MTQKPDFCKRCPINHVTSGYVPLKLRDGHTLVVGEAAGEEEIKTSEGFSGGSGTWLKNMFKIAGQPWAGVSTLNVLGCRPPDNVFPGDTKWHATSKEDARAAVEYCKQQHLYPALAKAKKSGHAAKVYAVGGKALEALTGKHGILTWRGSVLPLLGEKQPTVIPTIHPAALMRQAKLTSVVVRDLRRTLQVAPENYNLFPSIQDVQRFRSKSFAFDFEWDANGNITVCGLSDRMYHALVVPWYEPFISEVRRIFEAAEHIIGHNIVGADLPFIERLGWDLSKAQIQDTMLKQHLCQPDYPHDLAFVASVFTNKVFWKGKGWEEAEEEGEGEYKGQQWRTWDRADALPRALGGYGGCLTYQEAFHLYNARDTDAEYQINIPLDGMLRKWELESVYRHVSLPAGYICRWMAGQGLKLDLTRLGGVRLEIDQQIAEMEVKLPDGLKPFTEEVGCNLPAPSGTLRPKVKTCKGSRRAPHTPKDFAFTQRDEHHTCECGKQLTAGKMVEAKIVKGTRLQRVNPYNSPQAVQTYVTELRLKQVRDAKTGQITTGKKARGVWAREHPEFTLLGALKEQLTLRNNFAKDSLLSQERMFFNLKVHGTAEGRLSSSGKRRGIDLNIQNQPEEFRVIYVPDQPDWGFVNIDISQGESWLTCWLAKDWERWEKLQDAGYDEHSEIAQAIFNCPVNKYLAKADKAIAALRQLGKKINHGRAYGMGAKTQLDNLQAEGYDQFTLGDIKEFIEIWRKLNAGTALWQAQTMEIAARQGYLRNPFGRVRWFSHRDGTQALAFLPASSLADMALRMMICHYPEHFIEAIIANQTAVFHPIVPDWIMSIQVHDSLVFQGPWESKDEQIERSSAIMTQSWPQLDGFSFRVDVKASNKSWGDCS